MAEFSNTIAYLDMDGKMLEAERVSPTGVGWRGSTPSGQQGAMFDELEYEGWGGTQQGYMRARWHNDGWVITPDKTREAEVSQEIRYYIHVHKDGQRIIGFKVTPDTVDKLRCSAVWSVPDKGFRITNLGK